MSRFARLTIPALTAALAASGCTMMMHAMTPKPRTAENPLVSGQPLEAHSKANVGVVTADDCSTWPFNDTLSVAVTEAQICVTTHKNVVAPPGWSGEPTANSSAILRVANDAGEGGSISAPKAGASKVGTCFDKGYNQQVAIWAFDYKGCAPNNGTVTASTRSLTVGDESWSFPGAAPPAGAGSAAPKTASAAPATP